MESKSHALIAGVFAIGLAILAGALALWLGKDEIQRTPYTIATSLKVSGLNIQAAVRYKGIKVGKVTDIDFDSKVPGQLLLSLDIVSDTPITQSTYATLGYQGVTGIAFIELDDDGSQPAAIVRDPKLGARIPLRPGLLQEVEKHGIAILNQTEELSKRLNALLDQENRASLTNTVKQIGKTAAAWEALPAKLDPVLNNLPQTIAQARESALAFKQFSDNAKNTSSNLNQVLSNLQSEQSSIGRLSKNLEQISQSLQFETLPAMHNVILDAGGTLRSINRSTENFNERPQSLLFGPKPIPPGPGETGFKNN
ncbi:MlaD family protein [Undibacterium macrobrachii]|uniref:Mammalian cell entry protein n=1 Tax=Undibacterium macrobrachii TaxID=1119058 RepID=A0ABQ2XN88_9BURK|nr:MlaD family protein [Undibacterium macrobrachii]GGX26021.1 mammalian cell entry protein [Undibacterium macrobrachii]